MNTQDTVAQALAAGDSLPAGPAVIAKLTELSRDANADARDLGKVLQLDSSLTTRVLKQVNSTFYGLSQTINTVTQAVVILGFQEIKKIALTVPAADLFANNEKHSGIDIGQLRERSIKIACLGQKISHLIDYPVPEEVFVAGILSDAGMVILNKILGDEYAAVVAEAAEPNLLPALEAERLGITHPEIGYQLAQKWRFPDDLATSIRYHHAPVQNGSIQSGAGMIYLAQRVLRYKEENGDLDCLLASLPAEFASYDLSCDTLNTAYDKACEEFAEACKQLSGDA